MLSLKKPVRTLILIMSVLVIAAFLVSQWYYRKLNASVDPRIVPARNLYEKYNSYARVNNFDSIFFLMDTIEAIYRSVPHYRGSYETGVLYNNRAASWLTIGLFSETPDSTERDSLLFLAEAAIRKSISIYESWAVEYAGLKEDQIRARIGTDFLNGASEFSEKEQAKYLETRIRELMDAQEEVKRRLSVSYTNLGVVFRNHAQYDSAALSYQKALELWDRNLTAENNLNILLGRPLRKQNLIQRLFPPERL